MRSPRSIAAAGRPAAPIRARPGRPGHAGRLALLCLAAAGCAPQLTQLGARVQVATAISPVDCHAIGDVDGAGSSAERAQTQLRNAAGEMHANTVVISESVDNHGHISLHGQAFGCRPVAP